MAGRPGGGGFKGEQRKHRGTGERNMEAENFMGVLQRRCERQGRGERERKITGRRNRGRGGDLNGVRHWQRYTGRKIDQERWRGRRRNRREWKRRKREIKRDIHPEEEGEINKQRN